MAGLGLKHMIHTQITLANRENDGFSLLHCIGKQVLKHYICVNKRSTKK